jgi:hypothetical protein
MTINTKFNIGDEVWFIWNNQPTQTTILNFLIWVLSEGDTYERYLLTGYPEHRHPSTLFPDKQSLLNSL